MVIWKPDFLVQYLTHFSHLNTGLVKNWDPPYLICSITQQSKNARPSLPLIQDPNPVAGNWGESGLHDTAVYFSVLVFMQILNNCVYWDRPQSFQDIYNIYRNWFRQDFQNLMSGWVWKYKCSKNGKTNFVKPFCQATAWPCPAASVT